mgnify:CR=1 FL=1
MRKDKNFIYLDNAATSFPKPPEVARAMNQLLNSASLSPGRAAHSLSLEASRVIFNVRENIAELFGCPDSSRICFTANVTAAMNFGIQGLLQPGDHVITTGMEHNSVMRPLRHMEQKGVRVSILPTAADGCIDPDDIAGLLNDKTRLIIINHVSNVTGSIAPLARIGECKEHALLMVDAAQSAGVFPIDVEEMRIDFLGFTGHKSLFGPTGTGGFYVREGITLAPLILGGTGSRSEHEQQPDFLPDAFEAGTPNTLGLCGLNAGVEFIKRTGMARIRKHEQDLTEKFIAGLAGIKGITQYGPDAAQDRSSVVSVTVAGKTVSEVGRLLNSDHGILVRTGLLCAPAAHKTIHTFPAGTVRFSFGFFNTETEIAQALAALEETAA